jgi:S1 RNA binding domain protein
MAIEVGAILEGKVSGITKFGAFIDLPESKTGMVHISEVAPTFITEISDYVKVGQTVKVKVLAVGDGKISLSMKQALPKEQQKRSQKQQKPHATDRRQSSNCAAIPDKHPITPHKSPAPHPPRRHSA